MQKGNSRIIGACICCGKGLREGESQHHPFWAKQLLCRECVVNVPRCLGCERKKMPYRSPEGIVNPLPDKYDQTICGSCRFTGLMADPETLRISLRRVLVFLGRYMDTVFDDDMIRFQQMRFEGKQTNNFPGEFSDSDSLDSDSTSTTKEELPPPPIHHQERVYRGRTMRALSPPPPPRAILLNSFNNNVFSRNENSQSSIDLIPVLRSASGGPTIGRTHTLSNSSWISGYPNYYEYRSSPVHDLDDQCQRGVAPSSVAAGMMCAYPNSGSGHVLSLCAPTSSRVLLRGSPLVSQQYARYNSLKVDGYQGTASRFMGAKGIPYRPVNISNIRSGTVVRRARRGTTAGFDVSNRSIYSWATDPRREVKWIAGSLSKEELEMWSSYADRVARSLPTGYLSNLGAGRSDGMNTTFLFGRCDMRCQHASCSVEGVYVQQYLPNIRAELHLVHELVHAWLFLYRAKIGAKDQLRNNGHSDDSLEEVLCNVAGYLYLAMVVDSLKRYGGGAKSNEIALISRFLMTKLIRNPANQMDFQRALTYAKSSKANWLRMLKIMAQTGSF